MSFKSVFRARFLIAVAATLFSVTPGHAAVVTMTFTSYSETQVVGSTVDGNQPGAGTVSGSLSFDPSTFTLTSNGLAFSNPNQVYSGPATFTATIGSKTYNATSNFSFSMSNSLLVGPFPYYIEADATSAGGIFMELNSSSPTPLFGNFNDPGSFLSQQIFGEFLIATDSSRNTELIFDPVTINVSAVPEPSTWAMMIFGFFAIAFMAYRKKAALRFA
jgi:hypothetical protein